jgi:Family of unknown function (DUF5990)
MPTQAMYSIRIRLIYDGAGPVTWSRDPGAFGLQDKASVLHVGAQRPDGTVVFNLTLRLKSDGSDAPIFLGSFVHGPPTGRFLYLGWRDKRGGLAQRLKLPLGTITRNHVREALARQEPLVGTLVDHHPKATSTGASIGGSRPISWAMP